MRSETPLSRVIVVAFVALVPAPGLAYPDRYTAQCWVAPGDSAMATTSAAATNGITLVFDPPISGGQYAPGQVYEVTVAATGGSQSMLGSSLGSKHT